MKYTIEGFNQQEMVNLGLDCTDAVILRFIVDFYNTNKMTKVIDNDKEYFWVNYKNVIEQLPILGIKSKDTLYRRFKKYVECGLMEHYTHKEAGTFSCYKFTANYSKLIYFEKKSDGTDEKSDGTDKKSERVRIKSRNPSDSKVGTKDYSIKKDYSINNNNGKFKKPSTEEIKEYCNERNNNINPEGFFDFYESKGWMVGKNKMKDWKATIRNWERNDTTPKKLEWWEQS